MAERLTSTAQREDEHPPENDAEVAERARATSEHEAEPEPDADSEGFVPGVLRLRVESAVWETEDARSISFQADGGGAIPYRPGQFLTFRVPIPGSPLARSYSLSSAPVTEPGRLVVTVKRKRGGLGSGWMCDELRVGQRLFALPPAGTFSPKHPDQDLLLVARGSGITPIMSIVKSALHEGTGRSTLVFANRDPRSIIFAEQLADLERAFAGRLTVQHWIESEQGPLRSEALRGQLVNLRDRSAFVCGSKPFEETVLAVLRDLGFAHERVHVEDFISLTGDPFLAPPVAAAGDEGSADSVELEVELNGETHVLAWPRSQKLLDTLLEAGIRAPFSCREGACSACACVLSEGELVMDANEVLDEIDLSEGLRLSCQSRAMSDRVRVSYDG